MNTLLAVSGALGGFIAFALAIVAIVRAIARQVSATKDNTKALDNLSQKLNQLDGTVDQHGQRIARLEGSRRL